MQTRSIRYIAFLLAILIGISVCSIETDAQRRRKRRARRAPRPVVTNPAIAPPGSEQGDSSEKIISTADENGNSVDTADEGTPACSRRISTPALALRRKCSTIDGARPPMPPIGELGTSIALKSAVMMSIDTFARQMPSRTTFLK